MKIFMRRSHNLRLVLALLFCAVWHAPIQAQQGNDSSNAASGEAKPTSTPDPKQPIKMSLSSPFATLEKPLQVQSRWGCWIPIQVTLANTGDPVSGRLELRLTQSSDSSVRGSLTYADVELPTVSNKQVWLYSRVDRTFDSGQVTFSGRGFRGLKADFGLKEKDTGARIVLSVNANGENMNGLNVKKPESLGIKSEIDAEKRDFQSTFNPYSGYTNPNQPKNAAKNYVPSANLVTPLVVNHKNLPPRWVGLQMADAVVLQDFPHAELSAAQQEALRGYAASGGALIAIGGANWDRLARSPLSDLWPVTPKSASPASNEQKQAFYRRYVQNEAGKDKTLQKFSLGDDLAGAPLMLTQSALRRGARSLWGSAMPMMAIRPYGAGQVVFLAGDPNQPPFAGWRGIPYFWGEVFKNTPAPNVMQETSPQMVGYYSNMNPGMNPNFNPSYNYGGGSVAPDATFSLLEELRRVRQLKTPPVSTIAWFLALYVFFLVPVNYCVLRMFDKRELAWVTVPVIVVAFSFMSYAAALRIKGSTLIARQINIVQGSGTFNGEPSGGTEARSDAMLWLFSPRKTSYAIGGDNPQLVVSHYINDQAAVDSPVSIAQNGEDKPLRVEDAAVNFWAYRAFVGHATLNTKGGVQIIASGAGKDQKPQVKNATPFDMKGVVLKWRGALWTGGDIKAGATATAKLASRTGATGAQLAGPVIKLASLGGIFPSTGTDLTQVAGKALTMTLSGAVGDADTLLVGWSAQPAAGLTIEDSSPSFENATLFVYEIT